MIAQANKDGNSGLPPPKGLKVEEETIGEDINSIDLWFSAHIEQKEARICAEVARVLVVSAQAAGVVRRGSLVSRAI